MREELAFGEAGLGVGIACFFGASAVSSIPLGRLVESIGFVMGTTTTAALAGVALLGIGVFARSWAALLGFLLLAGVANGLAQPTANLGLAQAVREGRWGAAFGIKQAAVPITTLVAGIAVPVIGLTVGWRWAFIAAAAGPLALIVRVWRRHAGVTHPAGRSEGRPGVPARIGAGVRRRTGGLRGLALLALGGAFGAAASNSLGAFLVAGLVAASVDPATAGLLLASGSIAGASVRIALGWFADLKDLPGLVIVSAQCAIGTSGFLMLAFGQQHAVLLLGTVIAFGAGWGWSGMFSSSVVKLNPQAPALASGIMHTGTYSGGVIGPLLFGFAVERTSFAVAWSAGGAALGIAALLILALQAVTSLRDDGPAVQAEAG
jgi:MFS family permease